MAQQRRRRGPAHGSTRPGDEPMPKAVEAMGRAAGELERAEDRAGAAARRAGARQLLKAEAEIRRRQVRGSRRRAAAATAIATSRICRRCSTRSCASSSRPTTRRRSTTRKPQAAEQQQEDDPLAGIRELARRQEALARSSAISRRIKEQMNAEEVKRQLERLTREQEELRQQAEELAQQMQSGSQQQSQGQASPVGRPGRASSQQHARDLGRDAQRRRRPAAAGSAAGRARAERKRGEQLRGLEQQMQGARPDERRRAMGDLQLEARQLADAERRLGNEASRTAAGRRRRRCAPPARGRAGAARRSDRAARRSCEQLAATARADERQSMSEAGREIDEQRVAERMREAAPGDADARSGSAMRQGGTGRSAGDGPESWRARSTRSPSDWRGDRRTRRRDGAVVGAAVAHAGAARSARPAAASMEELQEQGAQGAAGCTGRQCARCAECTGPAQPGAKVRTARPASKARSRRQRRLGRSSCSGMPTTSCARRSGWPRSCGARIPAWRRAAPTPEQWQRSVSAPGTEAFKQDFAKWESLKKNLLVALEQTESQLADQLRARETRERLNAGVTMPWPRPTASWSIATTSRSPRRGRPARWRHGSRDR